MGDDKRIRGPDEAKRQELRDEIQVMIVFRKLIEQDMCEFVKTAECLPFEPPEDDSGG